VSRPPRLIHLTTSDISLALLLGPQLQAFAAAGYEVIGASAPGPFVTGLTSAGIRHIPIRNASRAVTPTRDLAALVELRSLFRALRPDIVHTHNPKPGIYGRLAARAAGVPAVVNTVHGLYALPGDRWRKRAAVYALERLAATCSHAELVQNPEDLETLRRIGVPADRLRLLGNGVDLARFSPGQVAPAQVAAIRQEMGAGREHIVCLAVGRLVGEKGFRELFEAAGLLRRAVPALRIAVVGPEEPEKGDALTPAEIGRARSAGNVVFLGLRHDVEAIYQASDLFVLASHREGMPRAAMEAAATGLPIVATSVRGCRQVVDDGRTGLLVPVRDAAALATAIERLATDADLRTRLGSAGREKAVAEFDQQTVIDTTLETYARVLARRAPGISPHGTSTHGTRPHANEG